MHALYLLSVWLHILAAVTWIGGMVFLVLVVVPWLRGQDRARAAALLRDTGARFSRIGWACFAVLAVTGTFQLWVRGVRPDDLVSIAWLRSPLGAAVVAKLAFFLLVLGVSAVHDFVVGPRATALIARDPASAAAERERRRASVLGRANALLALALVALGVVLVRGWP